MDAPAPTSLFVSSYHAALTDALPAFYHADQWDMAVCPLAGGRNTKHWRMVFTCPVPGINLELKYACWQKFQQGWNPGRPTYATEIRRLVEWLTALPDPPASLLAQPLATWLDGLQAYFTAQGRWQAPHPATAAQRSRATPRSGGTYPVGTLRQLYLILQTVYQAATGVALDQARLPARRAAPLPSPAEPTWLQTARTAFLTYQRTLLAPHTHQAYARQLHTFVAFALAQYPDLQPVDLDSVLLTAYRQHLRATKRAGAPAIAALRTFVRWSSQEGFATFPFLRPLDLIERSPPSAPPDRMLPPRVLAQLLQCESTFPPAYWRLLLILLYTGMHLGEACTLPFGCLTEDRPDAWTLHYFRGKQQKEHAIPIFPALVAVIHQQQAAVRATEGPTAKWLFPGSPHTLDPQGFRRQLTRVAHQRRIYQDAGDIYRFQPHTFRHALASAMINAAIAIDLIQAYLGHATPDMTLHYAQLDETRLHAVVTPLFTPDLLPIRPPPSPEAILQAGWATLQAVLFPQRASTAAGPVHEEALLAETQQTPASQTTLCAVYRQQIAAVQMEIARLQQDLASPRIE